MRVDVIVTDRQGNPVTDLKLEDFEIQEDGKPQKAETFRLVKIDTHDAARLHAAHASARATTKRPPPPTRTRASSSFFLDDYHVMRESSMSVRSRSSTSSPTSSRRAIWSP